MHVCGNFEAFGDGSAVYKLHTNRPTWFLAGSLMPRISDADFRLALRTAFGYWSEVCDVVFTETFDESSATELITVADLGGAGGTLADQMLPTGGTRQLRMRVDRGERWTMEFLIPVLCHEGGHLLGLQHLSSSPPPDLMEPTFNPKITRPQQAEAKLVASMYGPPKSTPQPQPPANKTIIEISGAVSGISILGYRVTKL